MQVAPIFLQKVLQLEKLIYTVWERREENDKQGFHVGLNSDLLDRKTCYDQQNELGPSRLPLSEPFAAHQPLKYERKAELHTVYTTNDRQEGNEIEVGSLDPRVGLSPSKRRGEREWNEVEGRGGESRKNTKEQTDKQMDKQTKSNAHLVIIRVVAVKHFRNLPCSLFHLDIFPNKQVSFIRHRVTDTLLN